jgi:hypothetical protein
MPALYQEHSAPPLLQRWVECFWSGETSASLRNRPVLPDGCIDIVYSPHTGLQVVGAMSIPRVFDIPAGTVTLGIRFRPGMEGCFHRIAADELIDRTIALEDIAESVRKDGRNSFQRAIPEPSTSSLKWTTWKTS